MPPPPEQPPSNSPSKAKKTPINGSNTPPSHVSKKKKNGEASNHGCEQAQVVRTYKIGVRAPESLLKTQNELIVELEVVQHLRKRLSGRESTLFTKKLSHCSQKVLQRYTDALAEYSRIKTLREVYGEIKRLRKAIRTLHWNNPRLTSQRFTHTDIPSIQNLAAPQISEISLSDYHSLAAGSLKLLCKYLNELIFHELHNVPHTEHEFIEGALAASQRSGTNYSKRSLENRFEVALATITGNHSNLGRTAFYQLGMALKGYFGLRERVSELQELLTPVVPVQPSQADFSGTLPVLVAFYSIPHHLKRYLSKKWDVDAEWVRNTLVGWRRKIDPLLPVGFQIEGLSTQFSRLADSYNAHARNEGDRNVIRRLQRTHMLHLLPNKDLDLSALLPKNLIPNYRFLRNEAPLSVSERILQPHLHSISVAEFLYATDELIEQVKTTQSRFPTSSYPYNNCRTFLNKLHFIKEHINSPQFDVMLHSTLAGNRFTSSIAALLAVNSKFRRLFTAVRGIIALTLARKYPTAIGQFLSAFTPESCVTFPFTSERRPRKELPLQLLFNKYIVERKPHLESEEYLVNRSTASKANATDIFRQGKPIWLGLPIYSPHQAEHFRELLTGQRSTVRRKGIFWFRLFPGKKIVECLNRGAEVVDIRLNPPRGPAQKIIADITLSSDTPTSFQHRGRFLSAWDEEYGTPSLPPHDYLGSDFNRIGKYMIATANPDEEHDLTGLMELYEKTYLKLEKYRKWELPRIQARLSLGKDRGGHALTEKKRGRLKAQLTLLHRKREHLMKEMKRRALMLYLYIAWKTDAKYLSWDSIGGISTRGTRGALAQAITYLPKRKGLFTEIRQRAADLHRQGYLPCYDEIVPVSPFHSQICAKCFQKSGKKRRTRARGIPYDEFQCRVCKRGTDSDRKITRHSNSARVSALVLREQLQSPPSSLRLSEK